MITVLIRDNGEKNVIEMTKDIIDRELKALPGSTRMVVDDWVESLRFVNKRYVCFVEPDCLISSGYFASQIGIIRKDRTLAKVGILGTATGVVNWANRIYGYSFGKNKSDGIIPNLLQSGVGINPVQIAFIPGAVMRTKMLKKVISESSLDFSGFENLVDFSVALSLAFWQLEDSPRVALNPSTTYVTTEKYPLESIAYDDVPPSDLLLKFNKAGIR